MVSMQAGFIISNVYSPACLQMISPSAKGLILRVSFPLGFAMAKRISVSKAALSHGVFSLPLTTSPIKLAYASLHGISCRITRRRSPVQRETPGADPDARLCFIAFISWVGSTMV
eukprot:Lithocolla_globosa_v1_NODE_2729_length_1889_cov_57.818975.p2 type:complete len:115 gc:universal NODE_2729_length_1889_cov_57.818975:1192-1536(+)